MLPSVRVPSVEVGSCGDLNGATAGNPHSEEWVCIAYMMVRASIGQYSLCNWNSNLGTCTAQNSPTTNLICPPPAPPANPPNAPPPPSSPPSTPPSPPPSPPPPSPPPFEYFPSCFGTAAGGQTLTLTQWGEPMYAAASSSFKFASGEDAAQACRWWPNPPADVLTRALNDQGNTAPITQDQIDRSAVWSSRTCEAIRLSSQGWYWLMWDSTLGAGNPAAVSATDTSYTRGTDFATCGTHPPPPAPSVPPPPTPPPNTPAQCSALAPWWTYRAAVSNEIKTARTQCLGITEWFCARANGLGSFNNRWVYEVYCMDGTGDIKYCLNQYGTPSCEGEATCTPFTPSCDANKRWLECADDGNGITAHGLTSYVDENNKPNCLLKYGLMYEDFVGTCYGNYQPMTGHTNPLTATQMRPCVLDSRTDGFRNVRENLGALSPGTAEYYPPAGTPTYRGGYRGNLMGFFHDDETENTGITKLTYGFGINWAQQSPYWNQCNRDGATSEALIYCSDDPTYVASAAAAAGASFEIGTDFPEPPPEPPAAPPPPPSPPPSMSPTPPAVVATGPIFTFPSPPPSPSAPPPPTFIRRRLGERLGIWKRRLAEVSHAAWERYFPEKIRRERGDALYAHLHKGWKERRERRNSMGP